MGNGAQVLTPLEDARVSHRLGEGLFEVDRTPAARVNSAFSDASTATSREEKRMGVLLADGLQDSDEKRKSVSSMFPQYSDKADEDHPIAKPSFRRGPGGWRTAADNSPPIAAKGRGMI